MPENYILLETIELTQSAGSVTFDNIPQTGYTDLKIVVSGRGTRSEVQSNWLVSFNGSTANFSARYLEGTGGGASSGSYARFIGAVPSANATASTFGSLELYIPNYLSSANKSYSADSVTENNATLAFTELVAGLWSDTSAINSITISSGSSDNFAQYSTFSLYGLAATGTTPTVAPLATGGNIIENDGTYWIHTFTSTGTFTPQTDLTCDYLIVAGGGGGGSSNAVGERGAGGGGAGGYRYFTSQSLTYGTAYTATIGAGGGSNTQGTNSSFNSVSATGGGRGGISDAGGANSGGSGGSGGGAGEHPGTRNGGTGNAGSYSPVEGYNGTGIVTDLSTLPGAPGGGAGGTANYVEPVVTPSNGASNSITGTSVTYARGGAGGAGTNGGGVIGAVGTVNTGNGGQGGAGKSYPYQNTPGGAGGSGIVIIRYAM